MLKDTPKTDGGWASPGGACSTRPRTSIRKRKDLQTILDILPLTKVGKADKKALKEDIRKKLGIP
jgi:hypothetical protein